MSYSPPSSIVLLSTLSEFFLSSSTHFFSRIFILCYSCQTLLLSLLLLPRSGLLWSGASGIGSESGTKPNSKSRILPRARNKKRDRSWIWELAGTRYRIWSFAPKPVFCNAARRAHEWFCILQYYHTVPLSAIGGLQPPLLASRCLRLSRLY